MTGALAGLLVGIGVLVFVATLLPRRPGLAQLAARAEAHAARQVAARDAEQAGSLAALGRWLRARSGGLRVPERDLAILGRDVEQFLVQKLLCGLLGLALMGLLLGALTGAGYAVPGGPAAGVLATLLAGALFFLLPDLVYRSQAAEARADFRYALGSFLDLVALERAADAGAGQSLTRAAGVGQGWAFTRISQALTRAQLAGQTPWTGLADLGAELGIEELTDLADLVGLAGDHSVAVYDALRAQARTLRSRQHSAEVAEANARTEKMTAPATLTLLGFLLFMLYPAASLLT